MNRSMSGKFVARVIATNNNNNNTSSPTTTSSQPPTTTTSTCSHHHHHHRLESPSPRVAARLTTTTNKYHTNNNAASPASLFHRPVDYAPQPPQSSVSSSSTSNTSNDQVAVATVLPVYYEKDSVITSSSATQQLPVIKIPQLIRTGSLISNSANSGVGSATAVITVNPHPSVMVSSVNGTNGTHNHNHHHHSSSSSSSSFLPNGRTQPIPTSTNQTGDISPCYVTRELSNSYQDHYLPYYPDSYSESDHLNKLSNKNYSVIKGKLLKLIFQYILYFTQRRDF